MSATDTRRTMIEMIARAEGFHIAPNLSCIEILRVLYLRGVLRVDPSNPSWPDRDRFLCKGHAAAALYVTLAECGFFPPSVLADYNADGTHATPVIDLYSLPGVEASTASMGRGISIGIGMALAAARRGRGHVYSVYVLVGDGECQEGQIWEAAMLAPALDLRNLTVIVDANGLQGSSRIDDVMDMTNLPRRFASCGWDTVEVDGHDEDALEAELRRSPSAPKAVIARTVKGKGITMMEHEVGWHYRPLTFAELRHAMRDLR